MRLTILARGAVVGVALIAVSCFLNPCGKTVEKSHQSKGSWDLTVECHAERKWKGGGGRGAIPAPTGTCWGSWRLRATAGARTTRIDLEGEAVGSCTLVEQICKKTKTEVKTRTDGAVVLAAARAVPHAPTTVYLAEIGEPVKWPATTGTTATVDAALAAMPPFEEAIEQMIKGKVTIDPSFTRVLTKERTEKHQATLLELLRGCKLGHPLRSIAFQHLPAKVLDAVYPRFSRGEACGDLYASDFASHYRGARNTLLCPRLQEDLRRCGSGCPSARVIALAELARGSECAPTAELLLAHAKTVPGLTSSAAQCETWVAVTTALIKIAPASAAAPLLEALRRAPQQPVFDGHLSRYGFYGLPPREPKKMSSYLMHGLITVDSKRVRQELATLAADASVAASSRDAARRVLAFLVGPDAGVGARDAGRTE
jgi:hypothetical protein